MNHTLSANGHQTRELRTSARTARKDLRAAARNAASAHFRHGKAKVQQLGDNVSGYVQENPIRSLLIATATGAVLGAIWSRRR